MSSTVTFIAPRCTCCATPALLVPRHDLPERLAVCPTTGQLYRPEGTAYVPTTLPTLPTAREDLPSIQIDLSRSGYA